MSVFISWGKQKEEKKEQETQPGECKRRSPSRALHFVVDVVMLPTAIPKSGN